MCKRQAMFNMSDVLATAEFIVKNNPYAVKNGWNVEKLTVQMIDGMKRIVKSQGTEDEMWFVGTAGYFIFLDDYECGVGYFTVAHQPRFVDTYNENMILKIDV